MTHHLELQWEFWRYFHWQIIKLMLQGLYLGFCLKKKRKEKHLMLNVISQAKSLATASNKERLIVKNQEHIIKSRS